MTKEELIKDCEEKRQRFNKLSREFAPKEEVLKAFKEWCEADEKTGIKHYKRRTSENLPSTTCFGQTMSELQRNSE